VPRRTWSATERAALNAVVAMLAGSLFVTTYTLALGDPVPHHIDAALVGDPATHQRTVDAVQRVAAAASTFGPTDPRPPRCTRSTCSACMRCST
jgi:hypothetical protein